MVVFRDGLLSAYSIDIMIHSFDTPDRAAATTEIYGPAFPYQPRLLVNWWLSFRSIKEAL
jgi:hypothetical protein